MTRKDDVFAAADIIAAEGQMPSILTVRSLLGDRGSESTICRHLRLWKSALLLKNASTNAEIDSLIEANIRLKAMFRSAFSNSTDKAGDAESVAEMVKSYCPKPETSASIL